MKIGSRGQAVVQLQQSLLAKGYALPRYGADGDLGGETWMALYAYAQDHGIFWDEDAFESCQGDVPDAVMLHVLHDQTIDAVPEIIDITGEHTLTKGRKNPRKHSQVTTILLHQTAVRFGTTARNRERYGERKALHRRFYDVACHVAALRNGDVLYVNRLPAYVWHGNVANKFSIGIEIEGHYSGIEGDPKTISGKKTPDVLDETTIDAARRAVEFAYLEGRRLGMPIAHIMPHRCYSGSRRNDPGEGIWKHVGLWAVNELALSVSYDVAQNKGRPVPIDWDPSATHDWRGRPL